MADAVNVDDRDVDGDLVEDVVVADTNPPPMPATRQILCSGRTGIDARDESASITRQ